MVTEYRANSRACRSKRKWLWMIAAVSTVFSCGDAVEINRRPTCPQISGIKLQPALSAPFDTALYFLASDPASSRSAEQNRGSAGVQKRMLPSSHRHSPPNRLCKWSPTTRPATACHSGCAKYASHTKPSWVLAKDSTRVCCTYCHNARKLIQKILPLLHSQAAEKIARNTNNAAEYAAQQSKFAATKSIKNATMRRLAIRNQQ